MPKVRTNRVKVPEGFELIEPTLCELQGKMREGCDLLSWYVSNSPFLSTSKKLATDMLFIFWTAENDPHDGKRKCETLWPIFKISHQKSRYVFDLYHRRKEISKELYEFCLDQGYADRSLIAKWKKVCFKFSFKLNLTFLLFIVLLSFKIWLSTPIYLHRVFSTSFAQLSVWKC